METGVGVIFRGFQQGESMELIHINKRSILSSCEKRWYESGSSEEIGQPT